MTEEEINKKAEKHCNEVLCNAHEKCNEVMKCRDWRSRRAGFFCGYEQALKDFEKENAELKADNDARKFAMAMSEKVEKQLREENAELKAEIENDRDLPAIAYMQGAEKQKKKDEEELTKAKEIIKELLDFDFLPDIEIKKQSEQFLKD